MVDLIFDWPLVDIPYFTKTISKHGQRLIVSLPTVLPIGPIKGELMAAALS